MVVGKEESTDWVKRVVAVASATEDAAAINESHNAVLGKILFAVDAPDGEHDMEDVVSVSSESFNRFAILHWIRGWCTNLSLYKHVCLGGTHERSREHHPRGKPI
jgi:hypothetical protein